MDEPMSSNLLWLLIAVVFVLIILTIFAIRCWMKGSDFREDDIRIDDKVVLITGCNTGIGKETALDLAKRGGKIYMACRDSQRCEDARQEIINKTGNTNVFNRTLDLGSLDSIRKFVQEFLKEESRLHILINNAGVMGLPSRCETKDGFEMQIGVNHMGHFLLTNLLLDTIKASAPSRIVVITAEAYRFGRIKKDDLNSEVDYGAYNAYMQSKLANNLFSKELSKRLQGTGVTVNCLHPGVVKTEIGRHRGLLMSLMFFLFVKSPRNGAQTSIRLAVDPKLEAVTGKYFADCKEREETDVAKDEECAKWLWNVSEQWTGLAPKPN